MISSYYRLFIKYMHGFYDFVTLFTYPFIKYMYDSCYFVVNLHIHPQLLLADNLMFCDIPSLSTYAVFVILWHFWVNTLAPPSILITHAVAILSYFSHTPSLSICTVCVIL